ncbi:ParE toxin of type II toxin-antitoxin system, parDE [Pilibacter termitis]|uniref:ParE toxin of type II toxin-antitoxin system, parDE n=1 Tax=Pilibacter termitis TaxID=263852 RepID=A0A1T4PAU7_9ENTE|nr:type II toxin-antitoxin system RelE/ParE family toxin [Pilibacter termitis]SJZ88376.1 ParE toxin of type II toxin-antitoxin system, parDE [Pilibacter termitis]
MSEFQKIKLSQSTEEDLIRLREFLYHQTKSPQILNRFDTEIFNALKEINETPQAYPYVFEGADVRKKVKWRYLLFYIEYKEPELILVTHVYHQNEDWLASLEEELL